MSTLAERLVDIAQDYPPNSPYWLDLTGASDLIEEVQTALLLLARREAVGSKRPRDIVPELEAIAAKLDGAP